MEQTLALLAMRPQMEKLPWMIDLRNETRAALAKLQEDFPVLPSLRILWLCASDTCEAALVDACACLLPRCPSLLEVVACSSPETFPYYVQDDCKVVRCRRSFRYDAQGPASLIVSAGCTSEIISLMAASLRAVVIPQLGF